MEENTHCLKKYVEVVASYLHLLWHGKAGHYYLVSGQSCLNSTYPIYLSPMPSLDQLIIYPILFSSIFSCLPYCFLRALLHYQYMWLFRCINSRSLRPSQMFSSFSFSRNLWYIVQLPYSSLYNKVPLSQTE